VASDDLVVTRNCHIPIAELAWRFDASGGPGGQHANTANTRAEVIFDVAGSPSLGPRQRARLIDKIGPVARATAADTRSQSRNRELALDRLRSKLADALRVQPVRRPTRPTKAAGERRLSAKHRQSERKQARGRPSLDE
jgi:ribosome-associated protein